MNKKSILSYIRRSNPELLELREGALIQVERPKELEVYIGGFKKQENTGNTDFYSTWKLVGTENSSRGEIYRYFFVTGWNGFSNSLINISVSKKDFETMDRLKKIEIIGSEVQLNHLLRAIEQVKLTFPSTHHEHKCLVIGMYDNSKSVEQNLDNPELCEFLYKLLIK